MPRLSVAAVRLLIALATASPASATHVACGDVITQDTTLDSDLLDCPGDGVVIGASGITLDLAGHTIDGTGAAEGHHGVENSGADNVRVVNGRIQQFQSGVSIRLGGANVVTGLTIANTGQAVYLEEASSTQVVGNQILGAAILLFRTDSFNVIARNSIVDAGTAIFLVGFTGQEPSDNVITDNLVRRGDTGIFVGGSRRTVVTGNRVVDGGGSGIADVLSGFTRIEANEVLRTGTGISVTGSGDSVVTGNRSSGNDEDGVRVGGLPRRVTVVENVTNGNGDDGIDADESGVTITRNKANSNFDLGIEAVPGVTDGGGNKAHGNGNPAQCVNVACK
jgi:hypothetical protein